MITRKVRIISLSFYFRSMKKCGDVNKRAGGRDSSFKMQADGWRSMYGGLKG